MTVLNCPTAKLASNIAACRLELLTAARHMVNPSEVEDLTQNTLERGLLHMNKFQPDSNLLAWLRRIMSNLVVDSWRHNRRHQAVVLNWDPIAPVPQPRPQWEDLSAGDIRQAATQLPTPFRETFELFMQGHSYAAIAQRLEIQASTVGTRLMRVRAQLRAFLAPVAERRAAQLAAGAQIMTLPPDRRKPVRPPYRMSSRGIDACVAAVSSARQ